MKIFICRICGEVYLGKNVPDSCPFCGAEQKYFILAHVWQDENNIELTDISKKNLAEALKLEVSNTKFYACIEKTSTKPEIAKMFQGLRKVENEHASVFKKLLKVDQDPEIEEVCVDDPIASLEESRKREERASAFYAQALAEAIEPRVKQVFEAIMNVENDHIALDEEMIKKFTPLEKGGDIKN